MAFDDSDLRARQLASQRGFYESVSGGSAGARGVAFGDGAWATVVPMRPERSLFNAVVYEDGAGLIGRIPELARFYEEAGVVAWTVWVRPGDEEVARALEAAGHQLDATPELMAAPLDEIDIEPRSELKVDRSPGWAEIAVCNDRAYGIPSHISLAVGVSAMDDPGSFLYAARRDGEVASCVVARDNDGDCGIYWVATIPEARGAGLAGDLMRSALRDAAERGCQTTSLEATAAGRPTYTRLGYRSLGTLEMWERRKKASG
jgi:ribosomal protein S18 acetylase RimI-like enzyme